MNDGVKESFDADPGRGRGPREPGGPGAGPGRPAAGRRTARRPARRARRAAASPKMTFFAGTRRRPRPGRQDGPHRQPARRPLRHRLLPPRQHRRGGHGPLQEGHEGRVHGEVGASGPRPSTPASTVRSNIHRLSSAASPSFTPSRPRQRPGDLIRRTAQRLGQQRGVGVPHLQRGPGGQSPLFPHGGQEHPQGVGSSEPRRGNATDPMRRPPCPRRARRPPAGRARGTGEPSRRARPWPGAPGAGHRPGPVPNPAAPGGRRRAGGRPARGSGPSPPGRRGSGRGSFGSSTSPSSAANPAG